MLQLLADVNLPLEELERLLVPSKAMLDDLLPMVRSTEEFRTHLDRSQVSCLYVDRFSDFGEAPWTKAGIRDGSFGRWRSHIQELVAFVHLPDRRQTTFADRLAKTSAFGPNGAEDVPNVMIVECALVSEWDLVTVLQETAGDDAHAVHLYW
jgi:hypothetical protein